MDRNFQRALPLVLKHEGGFVHHPDDPGGATNKGVTLQTFRRYVKADATVADLKRISDKQVAAVYYRHYWAAVQAPALPSGIDYAVFDFAVNSGPSRAAKFLQRIVGAKVDGRIGPNTIAAVEMMAPETVIQELCDKRLAWLKGLSHWQTFGRGWTRRVGEVRRDAMGMVGRSANIKIVEKDKPVVPVTVDDQVNKKTGFWQWLTGVFGGGAAGVAGFLGAEWQTVAVIILGAIIMLVIVVLLRRQIGGAIREIRASVEGA